MQRHTISSMEAQLLTLREGLEATPNPAEDTTGIIRYQVKHSGETLQEVSVRYYGGTPDKWQAIAEQNGIEYPYELYSGLVLQIPKA